MKKIKYKANYGYAGTDVEDELEYPASSLRKRRECNYV